jgi:pSer/pThr/pTyr-binding forkhead associated (FHA) protein
VVVFANGTSFNGVTRFGRENTMGLHGPDYVMGEQIASRSHFHVVFDQKTDSFSVMDAGSKWGTYVKLQGERVLSCGDWLRVGNAEFIIRYCGGTCQKSKGHRHYKLHAAKVMQDVKKARQMHSFSDGSIQARQMHSSSDGSIQEQQLQDDDAVSDEDDPTFVLGPRRRTPWTPACTRHSMQTISQNAGLETSGCLDGQQALSWPLAPLELDFISGGRMGEKLILNSRVATLGRSEDCTIPVNDTTFANVSRTHCVFEFKNGRWTIRDNNSTNGTWRRTSCILQPSRPEVLQVGGRVFAGLHELSVQEEASMTHWWAPSAGVAALSALLLRPTRDSPLRRTSITRAAFAANTLDSSDNEGTIASV